MYCHVIIHVTWLKISLCKGFKISWRYLLLLKRLVTIAATNFYLQYISINHSSKKTKKKESIIETETNVLVKVTMKLCITANHESTLIIVHLKPLIATHVRVSAAYSCMNCKSNYNINFLRVFIWNPIKAIYIKWHE